MFLVKLCYDRRYRAMFTHTSVSTAHVCSTMQSGLREVQNHEETGQAAYIRNGKPATLHCSSQIMELVEYL